MYKTTTTSDIKTKKQLKRMNKLQFKADKKIIKIERKYNKV